MFETLRRERATHATEWELTMSLMGSFMGVKSESYAPTLASMKVQLEKRMSGQAYSATFVKEALLAKREELDRDSNLLDRLDKLGREEDT